MDENPSTTSGAISIMETLQSYVPWHGDHSKGKPHVTPVFADGGACELMVGAQRRRVTNASHYERLLGLEPSPQEFHHRGIIMQVHTVKEKYNYDVFFNTFCHGAMKKQMICHYLQCPV